MKYKIFWGKKYNWILKLTYRSQQPPTIKKKKKKKKKSTCSAFVDYVDCQTIINPQHIWMSH
jgi:hypothetical protein